MSHVAGQILAAVESRLSALATVHVIPTHMIDLATLPAIILEEIEDETEKTLGDGPVDEIHRLRFTAFACIATGSGFQTAANTLRTQIERALLATESDTRLGGLCRPGLTRESALWRVDSESLQKPVGGWALRFACVYHLNTGSPDTPI